MKIEKLGYYKTVDKGWVHIIHTLDSGLFLGLNERERVVYYYSNGNQAFDSGRDGSGVSLVKYVGKNKPESFRSFVFTAWVGERESNFSEDDAVSKALKTQTTVFFASEEACEESLKRGSFYDETPISKWRVTMEELSEEDTDAEE